MTNMNKIVAGVVKFQQEEFPKHKELFDTLAKDQQPEVLFITCADSRIDPNLITQTAPGELFVCRNAGNIVPPHNDDIDGMAASIEFAVSVLNVSHIVVCGHSGCGAMEGALAPEKLESLPHATKWISHTHKAILSVNEKMSAASEADKLTMLIQENVLLQLSHLRTHPTVAARLSEKNLDLHGWVYDIKSGGVTAYDDNSKTFAPIADKYQAAASKAMNSPNGH